MNSLSAIGVGSQGVVMAEPIVDRTFAEKFLTAVDRPFDYGVYFLFHEWWAGAPQEAIDAYSAELGGTDGIDDFLAEGHEHLSSQGTLDRLPADLNYTIVRGFQIHDFLHVITGFSPEPVSEPAQAAFRYAHLRFPYHALRVAVTTAHIAFVKPETILPAMDAMSVVGPWVVLPRTCTSPSGKPSWTRRSMICANVWASTSVATKRSERARTATLGHGYRRPKTCTHAKPIPWGNRTC